jgi:hypothetical protein
MMYVLTQEELDKLVPKKDLDAANTSLDAANAGLEWMRNIFVSECPFHPAAPPGVKPYYYCSECPLSDLGAHSKGLEQRPRPTSEISKAICPLRRAYPK